MHLHSASDVFEELIPLTAGSIGIPEMAVRRDYFICLVLKNLSLSTFVSDVVFKGGTSLSKCYPGSIERFSEDIDLTYIGTAGGSDPHIERQLKRIEACLVKGLSCEAIPSERGRRRKSSYVWFSENLKEAERVKLEIGSRVKPHPYGMRSLRSYIHDYLLARKNTGAIEEFDFTDIWVNVLGIERTFIDKLFAVKRHAMTGELAGKVRHLYDVVRLFQRDEVQAFLSSAQFLQEVVADTRVTDREYLGDSCDTTPYNPFSPYGFSLWEDKLTPEVVESYRRLHLDLLYTDQVQDFSEAMDAFRQIGALLERLGE